MANYVGIDLGTTYCAVAYIDEALKSGLHPKDLTKEDVKVLEETYGKQWYESWGYTKEDLKSKYHCFRRC